MSLADDLKNGAIEELVGLLAEYNAENAKASTDKNNEKLAKIRDRLSELVNNYGISETTVYNPGPPAVTVEDEANRRTTLLIDTYNNEKSAKLTKEYKEAYNKKKAAQISKNAVSESEANADLTRIKNELQNTYGKSDADIQAIEVQAESEFEASYTPTLKDKFIKRSGELDADMTNTTAKKAHKIVDYKKKGGASRLGLNAITAATCTALIMAGAGLTLTAPHLAVIGGISFAALLGAEGNRRLLTRMYNGRAVTLNEIYTKRLEKANLKLEKRKTQAKAKFNTKTGKHSRFYESRVKKQQKAVNNLKHKIVKVNKKGPLANDIKATAVQILLAVLLSQLTGPFLAAQVGVGVVTFITSKLIKKIKSMFV